MLDQLCALFALKWTLIQRGMNKRALWGYVIFSVLLFLGTLLAMIVGILFYGLALYTVRQDSPAALLLLLNGAVGVYLFFYLWGVLMELQRADLVDFRQMLLLPVSLPVVYSLNFIVSVFSPILLFAVPGLAGLLIGLSHQYGFVAYLAGIPLALLFMLMMGAWAYYLRGRLAIIMENKRRRRLALVILPLCFVALGQLPAVVSHLAMRSGNNFFSQDALAAALPGIFLITAAIPVFWPAYGLWAALQELALVHVASAAMGMFLCTVLGLRLGYVSTVRHYMGAYDTTQPRDRISKGKAGQHGAIPKTAGTLPLLSDDTTALTLSFYHSFARHPHIRMLLVMPLCLGLFFLFMYRTGAYGGFLAGESTWIPMATLVWPYFNFSLFLFNIFGVDAPSFHGLLLLPTPRHRILLAKNLALAPFVIGLAIFFVAVGALLAWAPPRTIVLSLMLVAHLYLLFCITGNFLSIQFPYRFNRDALRMPTGRLRMLLVGLGSTALVAILVTPAALCMWLDRTYADHAAPGIRHAGLSVAAVLLMLTVCLYYVALIRLGDRFAMREQKMYVRISADRE